MVVSRMDYISKPAIVIMFLSPLSMSINQRKLLTTILLECLQYLINALKDQAQVLADCIYVIYNFGPRVRGVRYTNSLTLLAPLNLYHLIFSLI